jgi:hypothetical protein
MLREVPYFFKLRYGSGVVLLYGTFAINVSDKGCPFGKEFLQAPRKYGPIHQTCTNDNDFTGDFTGKLPPEGVAIQDMIY